MYPTYDLAKYDIVRQTYDIRHLTIRTMSHVRLYDIVGPGDMPWAESMWDAGLEAWGLPETPSHVSEASSNVTI